MLQESTRGNQTSLISPSSGDATTRQRACEEEEAYVAQARARRYSIEAEKLNRETDYQIRTPHIAGVEQMAAQRADRVVLGDTTTQEAAGLWQVLIRISGRIGLMQRNGQLYLRRPGGKVHPIQSVDELKAVVTLAYRTGNAYQCPWMRFRVDRKGVKHAEDAEPRQAAWRVVLASPVHPADIPTWTGPGHDGETGVERALALLNQAVAARRALADAQKHWDVTSDELSQRTGWPRREIERLIEQAGIPVSRPLTASGRPRKHPTTRRTLLRLQIER